VPAQGLQHGACVLGGRDGVAARGVKDNDAVARGSVNVDVVNACVRHVASLQMFHVSTNPVTKRPVSNSYLSNKKKEWQGP
jgi:hypothetical protein